MMNVVPFKGGVRCDDCGEQISPARVRILDGKAKRCVSCEDEREGRIARARWASRPQDIEIIRG